MDQAIFVIGPHRSSSQTFNRERAGLLASMLVLVVVALLLPAIFDLAVGAGQSRAKRPRITDEALSLAVSLVLLLLYGGNLLYTLVTHRDVFTSVTEDRQAEPAWGLGQALAILVGATIAIAFGAEMVSGGDPGRVGDRTFAGARVLGNRPPDDARV